MTSYLQQMQLPSPTIEVMDFMDSPIQIAELEKVLGQFAKYKTPCLDSIPIEWYLAHKDEVLSRLLSLYRFILEERTLQNSERSPGCANSQTS